MDTFMDILNSAMLIVLREILTPQDINTTPKELKTEQDCSHRQLFRPFFSLCQALR